MGQKRRKNGQLCFTFHAPHPTAPATHFLTLLWRSGAKSTDPLMSCSDHENKRSLSLTQAFGLLCKPSCPTDGSGAHLSWWKQKGEIVSFHNEELFSLAILHLWGNDSKQQPQKHRALCWPWMELAPSSEQSLLLSLPLSPCPPVSYNTANSQDPLVPATHSRFSIFCSYFLMLLPNIEWATLSLPEHQETSFRK